MTDMGNALVSIVEDSLGWHDPLGGHINRSMVAAKFGERNYQEYRNDFYRNARDNFLIELTKHGLGLADIVANVNFFSKVIVDDEGRMQFVPDHCPAGARIRSADRDGRPLGLSPIARTRWRLPANTRAPVWRSKFFRAIRRGAMIFAATFGPNAAARWR